MKRRFRKKKKQTDFSTCTYEEGPETKATN